MTIDERIEKLTERHEALAATVELTQHEIADLKDSVEGLRERTDALAATVELTQHEIADLKDSVGGLRERTDVLLTSTENLLRVAQAHENRISKLEDR